MKTFRFAYALIITKKISPPFLFLSAPVFSFNVFSILCEITGNQGLRNGGSGGTSYPGLGGAGRVQVAALSFGPNLRGEPKLSEDLFFALHLILGKK